MAKKSRPLKTEPMTAAEIAAYALRFPEAVLDHPFGDTPDVYKVAGRVFAIIRPDSEPPDMALKCEPEMAILLRRKYPAIIPGWHLNKRHWNTISIDGTISGDEMRDMIFHSYEQVIAKLPKIRREPLIAELGRRIDLED